MDHFSTIPHPLLLQLQKCFMGLTLKYLIENFQVDQIIVKTDIFLCLQHMGSFGVHPFIPTILKYFIIILKKHQDGNFSIIINIDHIVILGIIKTFNAFMSRVVS